MSSPSVESDVVGNEGGENDSESLGNGNGMAGTQEESASSPESGRIVELLQEERDAASTPVENGFRGQGFKQHQDDVVSEDGSLQPTIRGTGSPAESFVSGPDEATSVQVCLPVQMMRALRLIEVVRDLYCPHLEVVFCHLWLHDRTSGARLHPFVPSIADFNHDWAPHHSIPHDHYHLPS
jgi:hypothetical protein